ncbi:hypothetical protein SH661x_001547 [Planctomicrobium sp. SH661]|uniref:hypothetical protein n=1 Tax=Planctomicrobium sp. SH661 TaxID=3448124 RepID=UPI003F5C200C
MPFTLIVVPVFLLAALCIRWLGPERSRASLAVALLAPLAGFALLAFQIFDQQSPIGLLWRDDSLSRLTTLIACSVCLIVGLIETSPILLTATLWSAGMLVLASVGSLSAVQWGALQFSVLPLMFYHREKSAVWKVVLTRHATLLLGSLLFGAGYLLVSSFDPAAPPATIGMVLLLSGLGGMLGWFPFPRAASGSSIDDSPGAVFGKRSLPLLTAAVLLYRLIERQPLAMSQSTLLALAALFSLVLCGARLLQEERLSRRLVLTSISTFGFLLIAIFLQNWEYAYPDRDWELRSNLPGGRALFLSIMACETAGLLAAACGFRLMNAEQTQGDFAQTLGGAAGRRPLAGAASMGGLMSLAGLPPFPGFWWRFGLMAALLLPHRQSNVTKVVEADPAFSLLAVLVVVAIAINTLGHLRLLQQMLFEEPFRLRAPHPGKSGRLAAGLALILLLATSMAPLSLARILDEGGSDSLARVTPLRHLRSP